MTDILHLGRNVFKVTRYVDDKTYFIHVHAEDKDEAADKADQIPTEKWIKVDL